MLSGRMIMKVLTAGTLLAALTLPQTFSTTRSVEAATISRSGAQGATGSGWTRSDPRCKMEVVCTVRWIVASSNGDGYWGFKCIREYDCQRWD